MPLSVSHCWRKVRVPRRRSAAGSTPPGSRHPSSGLGRRCHLHEGTRHMRLGTPDQLTVLLTAPTTQQCCIVQSICCALAITMRTTS